MSTSGVEQVHASQTAGAAIDDIVAALVEVEDSRCGSNAQAWRRVASAALRLHRIAARQVRLAPRPSHWRSGEHAQVPSGGAQR